MNGKIHTKAIVDVSRGGESFESWFTWEGQMTYLGSERLCLGNWMAEGNCKINYKMNFIQHSFQRFPQYFKNTSHLLFQEVYILIASHKKCIFLYTCKTFLKEVAIWKKTFETFGTFEKLLHRVISLKIAAIPQVIFLLQIFL